MELSDEQLIAALKQKAKLDRQYAEECPPLTEAQFQQLMGTLRQAVAEESKPEREVTQEPLLVRIQRWFSDLLAKPMVWAPAMALLLALVIAVPMLLPRAEQWQLGPSATAIRDPAKDHPLRPLVLGAWIFKPSFAQSNVVLKATNDCSFSGSLVPAPELNIFREPDRRYYRLQFQGQSKNAAGITGTGQLELKGSAFAGSNAPVHPKFADIIWARLTLSLQSSNLPPVGTVQELSKAR